MKTTLIIGMLACGLSGYAGTLFDQLCAFNPNWKKHASSVPAETERVFISDKQYIQTHLEFVIPILRQADTRGLSKKQRALRKHLIDVLSDYRLQGNFPVNYYRPERIPVFIDEHNTHCAVGYLMRETGYENLAQQISKTDNYVWVKDLKGKEVLEWQQLSGFSLEELKLIQGAYDSYMPFALDAPNYIEIPQKPEVICRGFDKKELAEKEVNPAKKKIWIRGEGKAGVLHGRWEQNFSDELPWIVGFYQNGAREGKWLEYYRGTNQLCRTEHWKNDKLNGIRTRFDRNGEVIEEILFENGQAVQKTNYDLLRSLKYVRKPLRDSLIWTEAYDLAGNLLASGHETVHNPGNLQWFQNIELTALNTMMLNTQSLESASTRLGSNSSGENAVRLYEEPPLVEYIKQGDWVYYAERTVSLLYPGNLFGKQFGRMGKEIFPDTYVLNEDPHFPAFDSVQVHYTDGRVNRLNGYNPTERRFMRFEWYTEPEIRTVGSGIYELLLSENQSFIKSYGPVNEQDERIGKWYHFYENGYLSSVEEFVPREEARRSPVLRRSLRSRIPAGGFRGR
jgi:antitoxin component YwqK of YwqJK toxin-antitoxin module